MRPYLVTHRLQRLQTAYGDCPVVVFQAPAGCGKATAAQWWASQAAKPVVWMPLAGEQRLQTRWTFLQALIQRVCDVSGQPVIGGELTPAIGMDLLRRAYPDGVTLILDDWHLAQGEGMAELATTFGEAADGTLTLLLTTRTVPDLPPLPAWQVRQRAVVVDAADLQFARDDVAAFLGTGAELTELALTRTKGKAFALVALAGQLHRGLPPEEWHLGEGLAPYFQREVLALYPADLVDFIKATVVLDSFTVADCEALGLTDIDAHLQRLQADQLFLDHQGDRFTFHDLARQALLAGMGPAEQQQRRLQAARALFRRHDQGCLPLYIAAGAHAEAARAIVWFFVTTWRELTIDMPVLRYWAAKLPAEVFETDAAGMLLHTMLHREQPLDVLITIQSRACALFQQQGERPFTVLALLALTRLYHLAWNPGPWEQAVRQLEQAWRDGTVNGPLQLPVLNALVRFYGQVACDPVRMAFWLQELHRHVPATPGALALHFDAHTEALTAFIRFGDAQAGWQTWYRALALQPQLPGYDLYLLGMSGELRMLAAAPPATTPVPEYRVPQTVPPAVVPLLQFERAEMALLAGDMALAKSLYRDVLHHDQPNRTFFDTLFHYCYMRLSRIHLQQGETAAALADCRAAQAWKGSTYTRCWLDCHEAAALAASGRPDDALPLVARAIATARTNHFTFIWVVARMLQAHWLGLAVPPEVRLLVETRDYGPALRLQWPELPPVDDPAWSTPPRLIVRSLGGLHVTAEGQPVVWKRSNAQILLLDLLIHPEGSTSQDLLKRYWPMSDAAALRKDIQALRGALEPDRPGSDSRYVLHEGGVYRLTRDPQLIWWDVDALRHLHRFGRGALPVPGHWQAYLRPFAPDFAAYGPFGSLQEELGSLQADLRLRTSD
jgi:hypothetical protein